MAYAMSTAPVLARRIVMGTRRFRLLWIQSLHNKLHHVRLCTPADDTLHRLIMVQEPSLELLPRCRVPSHESHTENIHDDPIIVLLLFGVDFTLIFRCVWNGNFI